MSKGVKIAVLIMAAGQGTRMGSAAPKQYEMAGALSIIDHSIQKFSAYAVTVVTDSQNISRFPSAVPGGKSRQESVLRGLEALNQNAPDYVLIHDAVRPAVSREDIAAVISALNPLGGIILGKKIADSLHKSDDGGQILSSVDRDKLWAAETPQAFPFAKILELHRKAQKDGLAFTDDAALATHYGLAVKFIPGTSDNFKITYPQDLERFRNMQSLSPRIGMGYDVHALENGNGVRLGGIDIPHTKKLKGHSDADVVLHALTDALLGTCGAGDIGDHFPPSDQKWKNADSKIFVDHAKNIVQEKGGRIINADITLLCEAPKIAPYRDQMRGQIAKLLGLDIGAINVKATTNEKLGFIGREEGIAAQAVVSVVYP